MHVIPSSKSFQIVLTVMPLSTSCLLVGTAQLPEQSLFLITTRGTKGVDPQGIWQEQSQQGRLAVLVMRIFKAESVAPLVLVLDGQDIGVLSFHPDTFEPVLLCYTDVCVYRQIDLSLRQIDPFLQKDS